MSSAIAVDTMRGLVLEDVGKLQVSTMPIPQPGPGMVRVRIAACGVCGSDFPRMFFKGAHRMPLVCGHEFSGTVESCGSGVERFSGGEAVAVFPLLWCGKCSACEQGRYVQCLDYDYLGSRSDGGFAEYVCAPEQNCLPVPAGVSLEDASMVEPAAVALHALGNRSLLGSSVAIWGCGPIGLLVAQWAKARGASKVIVLDVSDEKLELARILGFEHTINTRNGDALQSLYEIAGAEGVSMAIDAAGVAPALLQAMEATRRQGEVVLLGNPSSEVKIPAGLLSQLMRREVRIRGTWNSSYSAWGNDNDWKTALEAMQKGSLQIAPLISHRLNLEDALSLLPDMQAGKIPYTKILIQP